MKKYKLEISLLVIFAALIVGLMYTILSVVWTPLPLVLLAVCAAGLVALSTTASQKGMPKEKYAPKFFAQALVASVVGIAVVVAAAVLLNKDRFSHTFDLTERKINSLSEETTKFLDGLPEEVAIFCIPSQDPRENYCGENLYLREMYAQRSNKIQHQAVDVGTFRSCNRFALQGILASYC